jgi:hypothetical protein
MSQQDLEVVKAIVAATQRGDWEAALERYDPSVECDMSPMPGGGVGVVRNAVRGFYREWFGTWDRLAITPERFIDAEVRHAE